jgi:adenosylcobinamide-GDP ribazoletransferase
LSIFSLTSRIPLPCKFTFDASRLDFYLPVVGVFTAIINIAVFELFYFLTYDRLLGVLFVILVQYLCFNLFHLDGLADTADAFLGTVDREKTHAILKDSRVGTYGLFAGSMALIVKVCLLYRLPLDVTTFACVVFIYPICGRFAAALIPCMSLPAKPDGLGALAKGSRVWRCVLGTLIALIPVLVVSALLQFCLSNGQDDTLAKKFICFLVFSVIDMFCAAVLSALFYSYIYKKRLGGYTGDALGAAIETGEALFLLFALIEQTARL